jgi:hypothetical protein
VRRPTFHRLAVVALIAAASVAEGCGGGDGGKRADTGSSPSTPAPAPPAQPKTQGGRTQSTTPTRTSPEEQPGGAGDEVPARAPAMFTGQGGRITPRLVRVPPFIAIRVELRSADRRTYALRLGGKVLRAGPQVVAMSTTLGGLHHGEAVTGRPVRGQGNAVRIEASAEPGP